MLFNESMGALVVKPLDAKVQECFLLICFLPIHNISHDGSMGLEYEPMFTINLGEM